MQMNRVERLRRVIVCTTLGTGPAGTSTTENRKVNWGTRSRWSRAMTHELSIVQRSAQIRICFNRKAPSGVRDGMPLSGPTRRRPKLLLRHSASAELPDPGELRDLGAYMLAERYTVRPFTAPKAWRRRAVTWSAAAPYEMKTFIVPLSILTGRPRC